MIGKVAEFLLVFAIDPSANKIVITKGSGHAEVIKVDKVQYEGKQISLENLRSKQVQGQALFVKEVDGSNIVVEKGN